ncbi:M48 family metallopeptidase [Hyphomicrobium sp.]|jgi:Zn-dependent protease with chaperone function|uniref:M48 family metallopeptidase n=1 Tax=Hyphomicrobium sp. TaxID=82 RepID=UPI00356872B6
MLNVAFPIRLKAYDFFDRSGGGYGCRTSTAQGLDFVTGKTFPSPSVVLRWRIAAFIGRSIERTAMAPTPSSSRSAQPSLAAKSYCRFTAGRGQPAADGTAYLGLTGVEIDLGDGKPRRLWLYAHLSADEPIRSNAINVLLSSSTELGASLFVQGPEFAKGLRERTPHLSQRARQLRRNRIWIALIALIAALIGAGYALGWSPAKTIAKTLPASWRERLGNASRESMTAGFKECVDPAGIAALNQLTERLSKGVPAGTSFDIHVYDWPLMNAFAVPGAQIALTKGLIDKSQSPDEVAGVLAHEMGHGIEMHPEAAIIRGVGLGAALEIMMGGTAGGGLANVGLMLAQLNYSRGAEREADHHALELLKAAAVAPKGLGDFFTRVMKMEAEDGGGSSAAMSWFRTHPLPAERARLVRSQAAYPSTPALEAQTWQDLKSICNKTREPEKDSESKT